MTPRNTLLQGDALAVLAGLPAGSVQLCVTSTPYWQQREYRDAQGQALAGQWGREPTLAEHVARHVELGRALWPVMRDDGVFVLNYSEPYAKQPGDGLKPKDLLGIPWEIARALRADGWWWRSYWFWNKANGMPDSVTDRPGLGHEVMLMFTKSARYFWDAEAIRVGYAPATIARADGSRVTSSNPDLGPGFKRIVKSGNKARKLGDEYGKPGAHRGASIPWEGSGRARKTGDWARESLPLAIADARAHSEALLAWADHAERVWRGRERVLLGLDGLPLEQRLATFGYPGAHFATFPPDLVRPIVRAATSERGACPACGAPWVREVAKEYRSPAQYKKIKREDVNALGTTGAILRMGDGVNIQTLGWHPSCACEAGEPVPQLVLDPFMGSGTVGVVAVEEGRDWLGIDLFVGDYGGHTALERIEAARAGVPLAELIDGRAHLAALRAAGQVELWGEEGEAEAG